MAKTKYVTEMIKLDAGTYKAVSARAEMLGVPLSDFCTYLVMRYMDERTAPTMLTVTNDSTP